MDATRAVVLDGLGDTEVAALRLLDGTRPVPEALAAGTGAAALAVLRAAQAEGEHGAFDEFTIERPCGGCAGMRLNARARAVRGRG